MSLMSPVIDEALARFTVLSAFDFANVDDQTLSISSEAGSIPASVTFQSINQITDYGLILNPNDIADFIGDYDEREKTVLFLVRPSSTQTFELWQEPNEFAVFGVNQLKPFIYVHLTFNDSETYTITGTTDIELDKINLITYQTPFRRTSSGSFGVSSSLAGTEPVSFYEETGVKGHYRDSENGILFDQFEGEVYGFLILEGQLSSADLDILSAVAAIYGDILLSTNLESGRLQTGAAVLSDRTIDGNFRVSEGSAEISYYSTAPQGSLIQFIVFDSDEDLSVFKSELIAPSLVDNVDFPIPGSGGDQIQASKVSGTVQIDGSPAQRTVRAFGYNPAIHDIDGETINLSKSLGQATSDPATGEYTIDLLAGYDKRIFVVAFDDYGAAFAPDMAVAVGDRIHPTTPNGHIWECTGAGTLPSEEPTWAVDTETAQLYGTASMIAKPFYRPMVHGPVTPDVTEIEAPEWTPATLFSNEEQGFYYDIQDTSTLFQDPEGTIPVSNDGDPVGLIIDKSGNLRNASQSEAADKPIFRTDGSHNWLEFNGAGDCLSIGDTGITGAQNRALFGVADASIGYIFAYGQNVDSGRWALQRDPTYPNEPYRLEIKPGTRADLLNAGGNRLFGLQLDGNDFSDHVFHSNNYTQPVSDTAPVNTQEGDAYLGFDHTKNEYGVFDLKSIVFVGRALTPEETDQLKAYLADQAGVDLTQE